MNHRDRLRECLNLALALGSEVRLVDFDYATIVHPRMPYSLRINSYRKYAPPSLLRWLDGLSELDLL